MRMYLLSSILLSAVLFACASTDNKSSDGSGPSDMQGLEELASWMTGSFSSEEQAKIDPEFQDIRLEMVRIWPEREDGCWLYVEQASANSLDNPYRQRVYRLTRLGEKSFESAVYELNEPLQYAGAWKEKTPLSKLTPASLIKRQGASIYLRKINDNMYKGSTRGKECKSGYRGASYATSEVKVTKEWIYTWDRGYDADDRQVWGAVHGGYLFRKK